MPTSRQPNLSRRSTTGPLPRTFVASSATIAASTGGMDSAAISTGPGSGAPSAIFWPRSAYGSTATSGTINEVSRNTASASRNAPKPHSWGGGLASPSACGPYGGAPKT